MPRGPQVGTLNQTVPLTHKMVSVPIVSGTAAERLDDLALPRLGSPELEPYVAPFGRMMLAFARATAALIELVQVQGKSEAEAVLLVGIAGTKDLPKELLKLFKSKLDKEQDAKLRHAAAEYKAVGEERTPPGTHVRLVVQRLRERSAYRQAGSRDEMEHRRSHFRR